MPTRRPRLELRTLEDRAVPADGLMDTSFSGDGIYQFPELGGFDNTRARAVVVQPDGKAVVVGDVQDITSATNGRMLVVRLNANGTLDTSFSGDGWFATQVGDGTTQLTDVALQADGKIVVTGVSRTGATARPMTARLTADGVLDTTFNGTGFVINDFSGDEENNEGLLLQPDGKIVVVGQANGNMYLLRHNPDGSLDTTFSLDGLFSHDPGGQGANGFGLDLQPDGKIVAVGTGVEPGNPTKRMVLIRVTPTGSLDTTFAGDGSAYIVFPGAGEGEGADVVVHPDGKITAVGLVVASSSGRASIARLLPDGSYDPTFDGDGRMFFTLDGVSGSGFTSAELQTDGKVVVGGRTAFPNDAIVARFDGDGVDADFGVGNFRLADGIVYTHSGDDEYEGVAIGPDGFITLAGETNDNLGVIRYTGSIPPNDPPTAVADAYDLPRLTPLSVSVNAANGVLANDVDLNGDPLTAVLVDGPAVGTLSLNPNGSFTYSFPANLVGPVTFTYKATDGDVDSVTVTVTLTRPANATPTAAANGYFLPRLTPLSIAVDAANGLLANDSDPDGDPLTAILVSAPTIGTLNLNPNGAFTYSFPSDLVGPVTFTYKASDGLAESTAVTVTLTRTPNQSPDTTPDAYEFPGTGPLTIPAANGLLANDFDADGDPLTAEIVDQPAVGTVSLQPDGSFTYTYPAGFAGPASFTYRASDGSGVSGTTTVTLTRLPNERPVAVADAYSVPHFNDVVQVSAALGVLANDTDAEGDPLTATLVDAPATGTLAINPDGSFLLTGIPFSFAGTLTFTYRVADPTGEGSLGTVTLRRESSIRRNAGSLFIYGTEGDDTVKVTPQGRSLLVEATGPGWSHREVFDPELGSRRFFTVYVFLGTGDDRFEGAASKLPMWIEAGAGDDTVRTGSGKDEVSADSDYGGPGTDAGDDVVSTGDGDAEVSLGGGNDFFLGGKHVDRVSGTGGRYHVLAGDGNNVVSLETAAGTRTTVATGKGKDVVRTGAGDDFVDAGAGNDFVDAGAGDDTVLGGAGKDALIGGLGDDDLDGGAANDILFDGTVVGTASGPVDATLFRKFNPKKRSTLAFISDRIVVAPDNTGADTLSGGSGTDWFWSDDLLDTLDATEIEPRNAVT